MMNEEIESGNGDHYKANDERLIRSDEAKAKGCARLYEGIERPQIEDESQGQSINIRIQ
jgi:hypothetical protein